MKEEQEKKELKTPEKKTKMNSEKKFYLFTAIGCAAVLIAIVVFAIVFSNVDKVNRQEAIKPPVTSESIVGSDSGEEGEKEPVSTLPEGMIMPVANVAVGTEYGFHASKTLGSYYVHKGLDFSAEVGTEVFAADDGVVESIYKDDVLLGTEITIVHDGGIKTVYRFVEEAEGLKVGASVKKGDVIAKVAEATGNEYKEGAHLHFEVLENGVNVDPTKYLTLEEK
jgi:murein DD-endopeptidase MepM/ murein hydrolase activator NlpD